MEKILRKWLGIKKVALSETPAKNTDRWGRGIIFAIALCGIPFIVGTDVASRLFWFWVVYLTALTAFQAYLQWKYIKESKEYVMTLLLYPVGLAAFLAIAFVY
ncbi:DUF4181 domain-containing protein [Planomicrobium sp. CPCC 101079]|uniref:DUF4181 domain-containing protein n=1 Tax=Planomicrobium sp. CPCC 101079 TaxID=2599618 RepID=UPI0021060F42|nr:DUF4181 domain-containing protein [Planomicrobium sp. CPCC 101079]